MIGEVRREKPEVGGVKGRSRAGGDSRRAGRVMSSPSNERTTTTTSAAAALSRLRTDEIEKAGERDGEKERQSGADPSDRPALTSTPSTERRRRHRRRQHRASRQWCGDDDDDDQCKNTSSGTDAHKGVGHRVAGGERLSSLSSRPPSLTPSFAMHSHLFRSPSPLPTLSSEILDS